jgi:hypothetical protein
MSTEQKPDPARGWLFVERLLAEEDAAEIDRKIEEKLAAQGPLKDGPSVEQLLAGAQKKAKAREADGKGAGVPASTAKATHRAPVRRIAVGLAAAAVLVPVVVTAAMNGPAIAAFFRGDEIRPDQEWLPWRTGPTPQQREAVALRQHAFADCEKQMWTSCLSKLDAAAEMDPTGNGDPRVQEVRRIAAAAMHPEPSPEPTNSGSLKPPKP